jgi:adenylate kinase family enzyme
MKTLIWVVGIPGSGKTTVTKLLDNLTEARLFSYGKLLRQAHPQPDSGDYSVADYEKVNQILIKDSFVYNNIIIDGNPYTKEGFDHLTKIKIHFDSVVLVQLQVSDKVALARLKERGFPIQDETQQKKRIENFNSNLLPLISDYGKQNKILQVHAEILPPNLIATEILSAL